MKPNHQRFGCTKKQWDSYVTDAQKILVEIARQRAMITYGELAERMTTIRVEPYDLTLWEIIGDVSRQEEAVGRGLLSVVVVHKHGDMEPGHGFFELARHYRRDLSDRTKCFVDELHRVHRVWSR